MQYYTNAVLHHYSLLLNQFLINIYILQLINPIVLDLYVMNVDKLQMPHWIYLIFLNIGLVIYGHWRNHFLHHFLMINNYLENLMQLHIRQFYNIILQLCILEDFSREMEKRKG